MTEKATLTKGKLSTSRPTVLQSLGEAIVATDAQGRVVFMNGTAETMTGWRLEKAVGHPIKDVLAFQHQGQPCDPSMAVQSVNAIFETVLREKRDVLFPMNAQINIPSAGCAQIEGKATVLESATAELIGSLFLFEKARSSRSQINRLCSALVSRHSDGHGCHQHGEGPDDEVPPDNYQVYRTSCLELWKTWHGKTVLGQHSEDCTQCSISRRDIAVFHRNRWYSIQKLVLDQEVFQLQTIDGKICMNRHDAIIWSVKI